MVCCSTDKIIAPYYQGGDQEMRVSSFFFLSMQHFCTVFRKRVLASLAKDTQIQADAGNYKVAVVLTETAAPIQRESKFFIYFFFLQRASGDLKKINK